MFLVRKMNTVCSGTICAWYKFSVGEWSLTECEWARPWARHCVPGRYRTGESCALPLCRFRIPHLFVYRVDWRSHFLFTLKSLKRKWSTFHTWTEMLFGILLWQFIYSSLCGGQLLVCAHDRNVKLCTWTLCNRTLFSFTLMFFKCLTINIQ